MPLYLEGEVTVERRGGKDPDGSRYSVLDFGGCSYDSPEMKAARLFAGNTHERAIAEDVFQSMNRGLDVTLMPYEISSDHQLTGKLVVMNFTRDYGARCGMSIFGSFSDESTREAVWRALDESEPSYAEFLRERIERQKRLAKAAKGRRR